MFYRIWRFHGDIPNDLRSDYDIHMRKLPKKGSLGVFFTQNVLQLTSLHRGCSECVFLIVETHTMTQKKIRTKNISPSWRKMRFSLWTLVIFGQFRLLHCVFRLNEISHLNGKQNVKDKNHQCSQTKMYFSPWWRNIFGPDFFLCHRTVPSRQNGNSTKWES